MTDFPAGRLSVMDAAPAGVLSTMGPMSASGLYAIGARTAAAAGAVWPTANTAIYMPVFVTEPITVFQMGVEVTTQAGNLDMAIYDEQLVRLVTMGSTAVAAAGLQVLNIADTSLTPGVHYFGMNCDSGTAAFRRISFGAVGLRCSGLAQQAVGAVTLPNPAVFAGMGQSYCPLVFATFSSTTI